MSGPLHVRRIAVVGAGTMGSGIAQTAALSGFVVTLHDTSSEAVARGRVSIDRSLLKLVEKGAIQEADRLATLARLTTSTSLEAVAQADLTIEAVIEHAATKCALFATLDALAPAHAILASNTSSIPIARLAEATRRPAQVAGMHFMNPVPLMPLVEIVRSRQTHADTMAAIRAVAEAMGKVAVEAADSPGFIANRILMPMINEAVGALAEGVGTANAIDQVMKLGMKHPLGPLALADLIGLDVCVAILEVLEEGLHDPKYRPCPLLREMVAKGQLGRKSGQGFYSY